MRTKKPSARSISEKVKNQSKMDKNTSGSFYGQQGATKFDPQSRINFERDVKKKKYKGGVLTPRKRVK